LREITRFFCLHFFWPDEGQLLPCGGNLIAGSNRVGFFGFGAAFMLWPSLTEPKHPIHF
jgi:hypothetical protein